MLSVYVLSYDTFTVVENIRLFVYKWVKVGWHQVHAVMTSVKTLPDHKTGEIVRYSVEDRGPILLKVLGNGNLRELTDDEKDSDIVQTQVPRI